MEEVNKLKTSIEKGPLGALVGAIFGYIVAKKTGYNRTISVVSFTIVGLIIGSSIGSTVKKNYTD